MKLRSMDWEPLYGLDHATWPYPQCFLYKTEEAAREAIKRSYGPNSAHIVVRMERV